MGRKSPLTPEQWAQVERRHLIDGESIRALAKEFGVDEAAIRRKINPQKSASVGPDKSAKSLKELAVSQVRAESTIRDISAQISALSADRQQTFRDLKQSLTNISGHLASAAEYGAATAHRLLGIAHGKVAEIDDSTPLTTEESVASLKSIAVLTKMGNESSDIAINLLRANKDAVDLLNRRAVEPQSSRRIEEVKPGMDWVYKALESDEEEG